MRLASSLLLPSLLALPVAAHAEAAPMREGLWEISASVEMPGMPFKIPPTVVQQCVTKQDAAQAGVPPQGGDCTVSDVRRTGSKVSWKVTCTGQSAGKGEGEVTFSGPNAYSGWMKMETGGMKMSTAYKAKRVGDCK